MRIEWEGTLSITVVGSIAFGCNDPVLEIKQKEAVKGHQAPLHHLHSQWPPEKALIMVHSGDMQGGLGIAQVHIQVKLRDELAWSDPRVFSLSKLL